MYTEIDRIYYVVCTFQSYACAREGGGEECRGVQCQQSLNADILYTLLPLFHPPRQNPAHATEFYKSNT